MGPESEGRRGWAATTKKREELDIKKWNDEEAKGKIAIKMDDEEELLGMQKRYTKEKEGKKKSKKCEGCAGEFPNEFSRNKHDIVERGC